MTVRPTGSSGPVLVAPGLVSGLGLTEGGHCTLRFGLRRIPAQFRTVPSRGPGATDVPPLGPRGIVLPGVLASRLSLTGPLETAVCRIDDEIVLGPLIGVLVARAAVADLLAGRENVAEAPACRYARYAREVGAVLFFFQADDLDPGEATVRGYQPRGDGGEGEWESRRFPLPDVVYDRCLGGDGRETTHLRLLAERLGFIVVNQPVRIRKLQAFAVLGRRPELRPHLPLTMPLTHETLARALTAFDDLYLKPDALSQGRGVKRLIREGDGWLLSSRRSPGNECRVLPNSAAVAEVLAQHLRQPGTYLLQEGLPLATYLGNRFDFRSLVQKDGRGRWVLGGLVARIAPSGSPISSPRRGGLVSPAGRVLQHAFPDRWSKVLDELCRLSLAVAGYIDERLGPCAELGLDLGVLGDGTVKVIEVNGKPLKVSLERLRDPLFVERIYRYPIHYAARLGLTGPAGKPQALPLPGPEGTGPGLRGPDSLESGFSGPADDGPGLRRVRVFQLAETAPETVLRAGSLVKTVPCLLDEGGGRLGLSADSLSGLGLASGQEIHVLVRDGGRDIRIGPLVGVWVSEGSLRGLPATSGQTYLDMVEEARAAGTAPFFVGLSSLDRKARQAQGLIEREGSFVPVDLPLPDVIYNRAVFPDLQERRAAADLRRALINLDGMPFINSANAYGKLATYEVLRFFPATAHLAPETVRFDSPAALSGMLFCHRAVYLKADQGSHGSRVLRVRAVPRGWEVKGQCWSRQVQEVLAGEDGLYAFLKRLAGEELWIIQQAVDLPQVENRVADVRAFVQKDRWGEWQAPVVLVRLGAPGLVVASVSRGGQPYAPPAFLERYGSELPQFALVETRAAEVGTQVAEVLETRYGLLGEVAVDLGIDGAGRLWVLEANAKPVHQRISGLPSLHRRPFEYAVHLVERAWYGRCSGLESLTEDLTGHQSSCSLSSAVADVKGESPRSI